MAKKKKVCACALVNGHNLNCPFKNMVAGDKPLAIDFSALAEMLKEMEKRVLEENISPKKRKTRIFVAPVINKRKKGKKEKTA